MEFIHHLGDNPLDISVGSFASVPHKKVDTKEDTAKTEGKK